MTQNGITIREAQNIIKQIYFKRDKARGVNGTTLHLVEEVGELIRALRTGNRDKLSEEISDVLAWLLSVASLVEIDVEEAFISRYNFSCPKCHSSPCKCPKV